MADFDRDIKQAIRKLEAVNKKLGKRTLGRALSKSLTPTIRKMRAEAPVSRKAHKTYRGLTVAPGFLKRNIKKLANRKLRRGAVSAYRIGVELQAFYGTQFLDKGTYVTQRGGKSIKPYNLKASRFFKSVFQADLDQVFRRVRVGLVKEVNKAL